MYRQLPDLALHSFRYAVAAATLMLLAAIALAPAAGAQPAPPTSDLPSYHSEARALYDAQDWPAAAEAYAAVTSEHPEDAAAWFYYGQSLRLAGQPGSARFRQAEQAYAKAIELGFSPLHAQVRVLLMQGAEERVDDALATVEQLLAGGLTAEVIDQLPGLDTVRADPRFAAAVAAAAAKLFPCENDPRYRTFDFWVGEWNVYQQGQPSGSDTIEIVNHGCTLTQHWVSRAGTEGHSINFYDPQADRWHQYWVASNGNVARSIGTVEGDAVILEGRTLDGEVPPNGRNRAVHRPGDDGQVLVIFERWDEEGEAWNETSRLLYVRRQDG